jgi:hypothetical protein
MSSSERPTGLRDGYSAADRGLQFWSALKGLALLAALLAYAVGFAIIFSFVAATVSEGDNPATQAFVGP